MLFVINDVLGPIIGGGRQRCWEIIRRACQKWEVDVVVVAPPEDVIRYQGELVDLPNGRLLVFPDESTGSVDLTRSSREARAAIERMDREAGGYAVVHVETFYVLPVVPEHLLSRTVLAEQNIESVLVGQAEGLRSAKPGSGGGHAEGATSPQVRRAEEYWWRRVGGVVALCPEDHRHIAQRFPDVSPVLVPNGWDHLETPASSRNHRDVPLTAPRLLFYGDYDYPPNRDAVAWLTEEVVPLVLAELPDARFRIGGINADAELLDALTSHTGVEWVGYIDDLPGELDRADMMLCPIRIGGGVRVKVTEAIHRGCLMVSTRVGGVEWIPESVRGGMSFADSPTEFAKEIIHLAGDPQERRLRHHMLEQGRAALPTWDGTVSKLMDVWESVAAPAGPPGE
ncbi:MULTISPECIES: glycosyltransferase family 4 protein [Streptomyces]|nr:MULTISPECIES: glycosyltransferase family 4 protein [Streptomyces]